jgi:hypothetical protein
VSWLERYRPLDRYWPLGMIGATAVAVVFVASPLWSALSVPAPAQKLSAALLSRIDWARLVLYLPVALALAMTSWDARARTRRRAAALAGNAAAVPLSLITPDPARAPDVSREPLSLLWRRAPAFLANPALGVIATQDGLIWRRPDNPDQLVRWEEARLLEVTTRESTPSRAYTLYGERTRADWQEYPSPSQSVVPHIASYEQLVARQRLLLDLIAARTGLTPRTFDPALRSEDGPASPAERRGVPLTYASFVVISVLLALGAVAALTLPLTKWAAINAYAAFSLALAEVSQLVAMTRWIAQRWRRPRGTFALPPASPGNTSTGAFAMSFRTSRRLRLGMIVFGVLLSLDAVPLVLAFVDFASVSDSETAPLLRITLFIAALVGVALFVAGVGAHGRPTVVIADARGVSKREGKKAETIPWNALECVVVRISVGKARAFDVIGHGDAFTISWPTQDTRPAELPAGTQRVTAEEMAALIVGRSGTLLKVRGAY